MLILNKGSVVEFRLGVCMSTVRLLSGGRLLEEVTNKTRDHMKHIVQGLGVLNDIIRSYRDLSYEEAQSKYDELNMHEEKSDEIKRSIMSILKATHLHPEDREDLLRIILTLDDVIGLAKAIAKKMIIFKHLKLELPSNVHSTLLDMSNKSIEAVKLVAELLESTGAGYNKIVDLTHKIEELEEEVDDIRLRAFEELLKECSTKFTPLCIVMPVVIDDLEKVTDKCEDIADLFRLYAVSR